MSNILIHLEPGYIPEFSKEKLIATMNAMNDLLGQAGKKLTCNELVDEMIKEKSGHADPGKRATTLLAAFVAGVQEKGHEVFVLSEKNALKDEHWAHFDHILVAEDRTRLGSEYIDKKNGRVGEPHPPHKATLSPMFIEEKGNENGSGTTRALGGYAPLTLHPDHIFLIVQRLPPGKQIDRSEYPLAPGFEEESKVPKLVDHNFLPQVPLKVSGNILSAVNVTSQQPAPTIKKQKATASLADRIADGVKAFFSGKSRDEDTKPLIPGQAKTSGLTREEQAKMSTSSVSHLSNRPPGASRTQGPTEQSQKESKGKTDIKGKGPSRK